MKEKIYSKVYKKTKLLGSGASGECWLIEGKSKKLVLKEIDLSDMNDEEIQECH